VLFDTDSARIDQALWPMLRTTAALAHLRPDLVIELDGYADVRGSRNHNLTLSAKRVKSVAAFLIRQGIDPARIKTSVHGETRASANVRDLAGQLYDRRVSIAVTTDREST
jgi:peptidoglycan-associated lipoprotein